MGLEMKAYQKQLKNMNKYFTGIKKGGDLN